MTPAPFELPLKTSEAAALADVLFQNLEGKPLNDDLRNRLVPRIAPLELKSLTPYLGSLQRDPVHSSAYFIAVDALMGEQPKPMLLHIGLASAPASALYLQAMLIGRMRPGGGREIVVNAIPFASTDDENIRTFVEQIDRALLPRPQGTRSAIVVRSSHPDVGLAGAFDAFRSMSRNGWGNLAGATASSEYGGRLGAIWAAVRAGWRDPYSIEAEPLLVASLAEAKALAAGSSLFTKFTIDFAGVTGGEPLGGPELGWVSEEFSKPIQIADRSYEFSKAEIEEYTRLYGRALLGAEELFDSVQAVKAMQGSWKHFDFEASFAGLPGLTTAKELIFWLQWLKTRGRPPQMVAPNLGLEEGHPYGGPIEPFSDRLTELATIARQYGATLSIHHGSGKQPMVLQQIARCTAGRFNYKLNVDSIEQDPAPRQQVSAYLLRLAENLRS